jgi:transposase
MGEETTQFASRFTLAVDLLTSIASDAGYAAARRRLGAKLGPAVADALDAVAALHETRTEAVKDWAERRTRVLERIAELRAALARAGVDDTVRRQAGELVALVEDREGGR